MPDIPFLGPPILFVFEAFKIINGLALLKANLSPQSSTGTIITSVYFVLKLLVLQVSSLAPLWAYLPLDVAQSSTHTTTSSCCSRPSCFSLHRLCQNE